MALKDMFTSNMDIVRQAIKTFDVDTLRRMKEKKDIFFEYRVLETDFEKYPREMAELFVRGFTEKNWSDWGFAKERDRILRDLMSRSMAAGREDLFDLYYGAIKQNSGHAQDHPLSAILNSKMPEAAKTRLTAKVVMGGLDKVQFSSAFVNMAVEGGALGALDLLVTALKTDIHVNNEALMRYAAERGQKDMVIHLVRKFGADIGLAITTARTAGNDKTWHVLEEVRQQLYPHEDAPPTIESLSDELRQLKEEMRVMREEMSTLRKTAPQPVAPPAP